jgi:hypothetical protein
VLEAQSRFNDSEGSIVERDSVIYVFSNDGGKLLRTLGEKGVQGTDGTHFGKPQDVAVPPDGRILIATVWIITAS